MLERADASTEKKWSTRLDRGQLLAPFVRPDGLMLVDGCVVKECVLDYVAPDGTPFRELVPLQTILDSASQIAHLPVTLDHPSGNVTDENVSELAVGNAGSNVIVADEGYTTVTMAIRTKAAKDAINAGIHELSLGYQALVDPTPGVHPQFGRYDAVQVARQHNHIAIVPTARVGPDAAIRVDGRSVTVVRRDAPASVEKPAMKLHRLAQIALLLGVAPRSDSDEATADLVYDALKKRLDEEAVAAETAEEEEETLQKQLDAANAALKVATDELAAMKAAKAADAEKADHADMVQLATALGIDPKPHTKARDLRRAIALVAVPTLKADASDAHVDVAVELARGTTHGDGRDAGREAWRQPDSNRDDEHRVDAGSVPAQFRAKRRPTANEQRLATIAAARKAKT